jgi:hypothetical protein
MVLLFVNNYLLSTNTPEPDKKVQVSSNNNDAVADNSKSIKLPDQATKIKVSFDGSYSAYYLNDILHIINTKTLEDKDLASSITSKVSFYRWFPQKNMMILAEKTIGKNGANLKISTYNPANGQKEDKKDLGWYDSKSEVQDITLSSITNVIYIKITNENNKSTIYTLNEANILKKVTTNSSLIGNINALQNDDKMVYEDLTNRKIYATNKKDSIILKEVTLPNLLGIDCNDNIYIAKIEGNSVSNIYYGKINDESSSWKNINLQTPADKNSVEVSYDGKLYIFNDSKNSITDIISGTSNNYKGKFMQIYNDGVVSISDGKLILTSIKK